MSGDLGDQTISCRREDAGHANSARTSVSALLRFLGVWGGISLSNLSGVMLAEMVDLLTGATRPNTSVGVIASTVMTLLSLMCQLCSPSFDFSSTLRIRRYLSALRFRLLISQLRQAANCPFCHFEILHFSRIGQYGPIVLIITKLVCWLGILDGL